MYELKNLEDKRLVALECAMFESHDALLYVDDLSATDIRLRYAEVLLAHFDIAPKETSGYAALWPN